MKTFLFCVFCLVSTASIAQGVKFEKLSLEDALKKARQENKLIFIDVYTVWCGPCKLLDERIFTKSEVGSALNKDFISLKINAEEGSGIDFAKEYNISSYPTLMFLNTNGFLIHQDEGYMPAADFLATMKTALILAKK
jgi:thiol:disulfide interchange protein